MKPPQDYILHLQRYRHDNRSTYYVLTEFGMLRICVQREPISQLTRLYTEHTLFPSTPATFVDQIVEYVRQLDSQPVNSLE